RRHPGRVGRGARRAVPARRTLAGGVPGLARGACTVRFRRDPSSLRGSIAPVVTPFTEDGELDTEGLRRLIGWLLDSGSHGISLGGSTGEPSAPPPDARLAALPAAPRVS